jgi:hypothetical protein
MQSEKIQSLCDEALKEVISQYIYDDIYITSNDLEIALKDKSKEIDKVQDKIKKFLKYPPFDQSKRFTQKLNENHKRDFFIERMTELTYSFLTNYLTKHKNLILTDVEKTDILNNLNKKIDLNQTVVLPRGFEPFI